MSDRPPQPQQQPSESSISTTTASNLPLVRSDGSLLTLAGGLVQNAMTGAGIFGRDSSLATTIGLNQHVLTEYELRSLFRHNWLIRRVVTMPAKDMVRVGVTLTIHDGDSDDVNEVMSLYRQLKVDRDLRMPEQWARLFGRSYIVIRVNGDEDLARPLRSERVKSVDSLWVYDRYQLRPATDQWHYANPEFYQLTRLDGNSSILGRDGKALQFSQKIHKSRVLQFSGDELPPYDRHLNEGCDDSVVQKMFDAFRKYYSASGAINEAINSFSILTVSIAKLSELISAGKLEDVKKLIQEINLSKSMYGTLVTDAETSKTDFMGRSMSGVEGLFTTVIRDELTACSELPFYKLWGEVGRSGLTDSGSAESKHYSDLVAGWQEEDFLEPHERLFPMLMQASLGRIPEDWEHTYNSIYTLPPKESADIALVNAQTYEKLAGVPGVVAPEEIRQALANEQSLASAIDLEGDPPDGETEDPDKDEELEEGDPAVEALADGIDRSDSTTTDYHADDVMWDDAAIECWGEAREDDESSNRLYFFQGRRTGIIASSAVAARKKLKRGGKKLVKVRSLTAAEKKIARRGEWVRSGKNGEPAGYGGMRGKGPRPKSWHGDENDRHSTLTRDRATRQFILVSEGNTRILNPVDRTDSLSIGSSVTWSWSGSTAHGKVVKVYREPIELTIKGSTVKRNGSEDEPAVLVETVGGDRVLKLQSELRKDESDRADDSEPVKRILKWLNDFEIGIQRLPLSQRFGRTLTAAYGHVRTLRGADGMALDCWVSTNYADPEAKIFIVEQVIDGKFDEEKLIIGTRTKDEARSLYLANMPMEMFGGIREIQLSELELMKSKKRLQVDGVEPVQSTDRTDAESIVISGNDAVLGEDEFEEEGAIDLLQTLENVFEDEK